MARPQVTHYNVPVRSAAPQAIRLATALGWLFGKAIRGDNGHIIYGYPSIQTQRAKFAGYVNPPQLFLGYDPAKVAAGFVRPDPASLPGDHVSPSAAGSPIMIAMHNVSVSQAAVG